MKNLKRALSLALASVMVMGMMVVGTGASYKDVTAEHNEAAIDVMKAVGVMIGDDKGNFNPDQKVTRNEMAVVMANLLDLKVADYKGVSHFTDVPAWAQAYVDACYANKVVSGASATTYNGNATVTTAEAGLMVMKALGYFQYQSDFADDWKVATIKQGSKIDLFEGVSNTTNAALTRNEVAQLVLNALESVKVEAKVSGNDVHIGGGDLTVDISANVEYYKLTNGFAYNGDTEDKGLYLCEDLFGRDLKKNEDAKDDFGRPGTEWTYGKKNDQVAFVADEAVAIYAGADFDEDVVEDLVEDYDNIVYVYNGGVNADAYNGTTLAGMKGIAVEVYETNDGDDARVVAIDGYVTEVDEITVDDDDEVTQVKLIVREAGAAVAGDVIDVTVDVEDNEDAYALIKDFDEGDIFMGFWKDGFNLKAEPADALLAVDAEFETVEGEITATSIKKVSGVAVYSQSWIKVDGKKYEFANEYSRTGTMAKEQEGVFYLYNGYIVYADTDGEDADDEYLYVVRSNKEAGKWDDNYYAEVVFADGTSAVVDLAFAEGETAYEPTAGVYSYEYDEDDETYTLTEADKTAQNVTITKGKTAIKSGDNTVATANGKTVFVYITKDGSKFDEATAYTGYKATKTITGNAYIIADGAAEYVFVIDGTTADSTDEDMIYVAGASVSEKIEDKDLGDYYTYTALVEGKVVEIMVHATKVTNAGALDGLYNVSATNDDGVYTKLVAAEAEDYETFASNVNFKKAADDVITIKTTDDETTLASLAYVDGVKVYVIDDDSIATGSITRNYSDVEVSYTINDDGEVTCFYIVK